MHWVNLATIQNSKNFVTYIICNTLYKQTGVKYEIYTKSILILANQIF